jgi:ankyrin repeat protein
VRLLLAHGADTTKRAVNDLTALRVAASGGHGGVVRQLATVVTRESLDER